MPFDTLVLQDRVGKIQHVDIVRLGIQRPRKEGVAVFVEVAGELVEQDGIAGLILQRPDGVAQQLLHEGNQRDPDDIAVVFQRGVGGVEGLFDRFIAGRADDIAVLAEGDGVNAVLAGLNRIADRILPAV